MKSTSIRLPILLIVIMLMAACGPSPEDMATMTASAWTPTPSATPTPPPTPSPTPIPPSATPKPTDGFISGRAYWVDTDAPVLGVALSFGIKTVGTITMSKGVTTDAQGKYHSKVDPGSFEVSLTWLVFDQSDIPCPSPDFTLLGEWIPAPLIQLNDGGFFLMATSEEVSINAGDEITLDIPFSCQ